MHSFSIVLTLACFFLAACNGGDDSEFVDTLVKLKLVDENGAPFETDSLEFCPGALYGNECRTLNPETPSGYASEFEFRMPLRLDYYEDLRRTDSTGIDLWTGQDMASVIKGVAFSDGIMVRSAGSQAVYSANKAELPVFEHVRLFQDGRSMDEGYDPSRSGDVVLELTARISCILQHDLLSIDAYRTGALRCAGSSAYEHAFKAGDAVALPKFACTYLSVEEDAYSEASTWTFLMNEGETVAFDPNIDRGYNGKKYWETDLHVKIESGTDNCLQVGVTSTAKNQSHTPADAHEQVCFEGPRGKLQEFQVLSRQEGIFEKPSGFLRCTPLR